MRNGSFSCLNSCLDLRMIHPSREALLAIASHVSLTDKVISFVNYLTSYLTIIGHLSPLPF